MKESAMKLKSLFLIAIFLCSPSFTDTLQARVLPAQAVCVVPVANAFNEYIGKKFSTATYEQIKNLYHTVLATNVNYGDFMRLHQFLLHEVVTVIEEKNGELIVRAPDHFFQNNPNEKVFNSSAVLAEEFVFLDEIKDPSKLPAPYEWDNPDSYKPTSCIFSLTTPYKDPTTGMVFSIGTRFFMSSCSIDRKYVSVFVLTGKAFDTITIPLSYGLIDVPFSPEDTEECIVALFMKFFGGEKRVSTAFGGRSTTALFEERDYHESSLELPDKKIVAGYVRDQETGMQTGYTMPEVNYTINRLCRAQAVEETALGNSTTAERVRGPLAPDEEPRKLTYLLAQGYVGRLLGEDRIADIRSYAHHNGIGRIVKLSENFKGIETEKDLVAAYRSGKPLELLNGDQTKVITTFKPGQWKLSPFIHKSNQEKWNEFARLYQSRN